MTDFTAAWNLIDQPDVWPSSLPAAAEDLPRAAAERFHYLEASTLTNAEEYTPQHLARFVHQTEELLNAFSPGDVRARIEAAARAQEAEETRQGRPVPTSPAAAVLGMEKLAAHAAGMAGAADAAPLAVEDLVQLAASGLRATAAQIERGQPARQPDALDYQETYAHLHTREAEGDLDATLDDLAALLARAKEAQLREGDRGGLAALKEAGAAALGHLEKLTGQDPRELHEEALEGHVYHDEIESRYGLPAPSVAQSVLRAATRIPYARQKEAYRQEKARKPPRTPTSPRC